MAIKFEELQAGKMYQRVELGTTVGIYSDTPNKSVRESLFIKDLHSYQPVVLLKKYYGEPIFGFDKFLYLITLDGTVGWSTFCGENIDPWKLVPDENEG